MERHNLFSKKSFIRPLASPHGPLRLPWPQCVLAVHIFAADDIPDRADLHLHTLWTQYDCYIVSEAVLMIPS